MRNRKWTVNQHLQNEAIAHSLFVSRYGNGAARRMVLILNQADAELAAQLLVALEDMNPYTMTAKRLATQLKAVRAINQRVYASLSESLTAELESFAAHEATYQALMLSDVLPEVILQHVPLHQLTPQQVFASAVSQPFQGRLLKEWGEKLEADRIERLTNAVRMGFLNGETTEQVVRRIRGTKASNWQDGALQVSRANATSVVKTAINHVAATARQDFAEANSDLIKAKQWDSTLDNKTSPQCFPDSTLALPVGNLRGVFRRAWDGDVVVVTTASGKKLRATPNHPILTARGWRPINEVEPGVDILYRVGIDVGGVFSAKDVKMPATMGAIFDALNKPSFSDVFVKCSTEVDFHGDGMRGDYEINRPHSKRDLRLALESHFGKEIAEMLLVFVAGSSKLSELGFANQFIHGLGFGNEPSKVNTRSIEDRVKSGFADIKFSNDISGLHSAMEGFNDHQFVRSSRGFSSPKQGHNPGALKESCDRGGGDSVLSCDGCGGDAVGVMADDVVSVEREFFSGHVYNLSTGTGLYIADGFVVHNCQVRDHLLYTLDGQPIGHKVPYLNGPGKAHYCCRSSETYITKSWRELGIPADELDGTTRASMDGQVPAKTNYRDWLSNQSYARQEQVLGVTRAQMLRDGKITVPEMFNDAGEFLTLDELRRVDASAFEG